jgi:hypothetical protein
VRPSSPTAGKAQAAGDAADKGWLANHIPAAFGSASALLNAITMIIATELGAWGRARAQGPSGLRSRCWSAARWAGRRICATVWANAPRPLSRPAARPACAPPSLPAGDKTFCIAAVMAMRYNRMFVFGGAIGALIVMTVLSVLIGACSRLPLRRESVRVETDPWRARFPWRLLGRVS